MKKMPSPFLDAHVGGVAEHLRLEEFVGLPGSIQGFNGRHRIGGALAFAVDHHVPRHLYPLPALVAVHSVKRPTRAACSTDTPECAARVRAIMSPSCARKPAPLVGLVSLRP